MTNEIPPDEQAVIEEILKSRTKDEKSFPASDVKRFRQAISAELEKTGDLTKEAVERLLEQFRAAHG